MSSFICAWINGWVNNIEVGVLRRHRTHYEVTAMLISNADSFKTVAILFVRRCQIQGCGRGTPEAPLLWYAETPWWNYTITVTSQEHHGVTNHRQVDCLLATKKTSNSRSAEPVWGKPNGVHWIPLKCILSERDKLRKAFTCHYVHDDVIKWKHFPRYWPFVRGIHRSPVNSQHK